jgi:tRNA(adenine34) deaminase
MNDEDWMRLALDEARHAAAAGEVPVGAVLVKQGVLVATGRNAPIAQHDPSAHAEIAALRAGAVALGNYRLDGCELFVTLEPCAMCAGTMLHARLSRVVFGAADVRTGAAGSVVDLFADTRLNHQTHAQGGVLATECAEVLRLFFQQRRQAARERAEPLRDDALRTPTANFAVLDDVPHEGHYESELPILQGWRLHYLDDHPPGRIDRPTLLCLHGPGEWSYFFRHLIGAADVRVLAPDLIGFGRSDKPKREDVHQLAWHRDVLLAWLDRLAPDPMLLVHSASAAALAAMLVASAPARFVGMLVAPDGGGDVAPAWRAPFVDRGYESALRALGNRMPRVSGPSPLQAAQLMPKAMGYFAP